MKEKTFIKWLLKMVDELESILKSDKLDKKLRRRLLNVQGAYLQAVDVCIKNSKQYN